MPDDPLRQLKRLGDLRDAQVLTEEEFQEKKRLLLAAVGTNSTPPVSTNPKTEPSGQPPIRLTAVAVPQATEIPVAIPGKVTRDDVYHWKIEANEKHRLLNAIDKQYADAARQESRATSKL